MNMMDLWVFVGQTGLKDWSADFFIIVGIRRSLP